jgi:hypothetical protein
MPRRTKYVVGGDGNSANGCHAGWPHVSVLAWETRNLNIGVSKYDRLRGAETRKMKRCRGEA